MQYKTTMTHCGQHKRYGDFFREWEIETSDKNPDSVLDWCFENLYKRRVPSQAEWLTEIRYGTGKKSGDAGYYFAGYYTLTQIENGWRFIICEPYAD